MLTPGMGPATDGAVGLALLADSHPARQAIATKAVSPRKGWVLDMTGILPPSYRPLLPAALRRRTSEARNPIPLAPVLTEVHGAVVGARRHVRPVRNRAAGHRQEQSRPHVAAPSVLEVCSAREQVAAHREHARVGYGRTALLADQRKEVLAPLLGGPVRGVDGTDDRRVRRNLGTIRSRERQRVRIT